MIKLFLDTFIAMYGLVWDFYGLSRTLKTLLGAWNHLLAFYVFYTLMCDCRKDHKLSFNRFLLSHPIENDKKKVITLFLVGHKKY